MDVWTYLEKQAPGTVLGTILSSLSIGSDLNTKLSMFNFSSVAMYLLATLKNLHTYWLTEFYSSTAYLALLIINWSRRCQLSSKLNYYRKNLLQHEQYIYTSYLLVNTHVQSTTILTGKLCYFPWCGAYSGAYQLKIIDALFKGCL